MTTGQLEDTVVVTGQPEDTEGIKGKPEETVMTTGNIWLKLRLKENLRIHL